MVKRKSFGKPTAGFMWKDQSSMSRMDRLEQEYSALQNELDLNLEEINRKLNELVMRVKYLEKISPDKKLKKIWREIDSFYRLARNEVPKKT